MTNFRYFSWLPEKEISLEQISQIVKDMDNGILHEGYSVDEIWRGKR